MPCWSTDDWAFFGMADGHCLRAAMATDRSRADIHAAELCCRAQPAQLAGAVLAMPAVKTRSLQEARRRPRAWARLRFVPAGARLRRGVAVQADAEPAQNGRARLRPGGSRRRRARQQALARGLRVPRSRGRGQRIAHLRSVNESAAVAELSWPAWASRSFRSLLACSALLLRRAGVFSFSRPRRIWTARG